MLDFEVHWEDYAYGDEHIYSVYKPVPSEKVLPEWFKRLSNEVGDIGHRGPTAKTCRGLYDIMSSGYTILWPFDARIEKTNDGKLIIYKARNNSADDFHPHPHVQIDGYPDLLLESQASGVQKVTLPFRIKTPEGTSVVVKQPAYRPELKTEIMEGIIDTDNYYGDFNILFLIKQINSNRKIIIKAGTPLAQVIPFIRGEWQVKYDKIDEQRKSLNHALSENIEKFYQKHQWERKVFK